MPKQIDTFTHFLKIFLSCCWYLGLISPCMASFLSTRNAPVVNTTMGRVRGIISYSRLSRIYYQYSGIPYAEPPVGDLRFEAPVPLKKGWENVRAADTFGSPCLQFDAILRGRIIGNENCLFLNIFTKNTEPETPYPVMVWLHGGGFVAGSSDMYDPKYLMDKDIVVVTMNYRLASLGFFNTGDDLIRGNMGLKDQQLVLQYIQKNIHSFGGNPSSVTLFGESAGAASGSIFCPWAHTRSPQKQALKFGKSVGCPIDNTTVLVNCLKKLDGRSIVRQHAKILSPVHTQDDFFPGSVEAVVRNDTFLADNPFLMLQRGEFNHVPVIIGMNSGEGALKTARLEATPEVLNALDIKWDEHVSILLHFDPQLKEISDKIRHFYFPESIPFPSTLPSDSLNSTSGEESTNKDAISEIPSRHAIPPQKALENVTNMISDGVWYHATKQAALHHSKYAPVYLNYFSYHSHVLPSTYTFIKSARVRNNIPAELTWPRYIVEAYFNQFVLQSRDHKRFGACHGDDLMYYWSTNPVVQIRTVSQDYAFSRDFVGSLTDFITNVPELKFGNITWEPVDNSTQTLRYMKLDRDGGMIDQPFKDRIDFIDSLNIRDPLDPNNW